MVYPFWLKNKSKALIHDSFAVNHPVAPKGGSESFLSVNGQSHGPRSPIIITDDS